MRRVFALLLLAALTGGCAAEKKSLGRGLPTGDGVWFEDGVDGSESDLEGGLMRAGLAAVFLPAVRVSQDGARWKGNVFSPPARPFLRESVFLVVTGDTEVEQALGRSDAAGPLADALWLAVNGLLTDTAHYGPVAGIHLDFPFSAKTAESYGKLVSGLRARMPRGTRLSVSLRFSPASEEKEKFKALAAACDGFLAFVFGEGNAADSVAVDALEKHWWAGYAPSARGVWSNARGEEQGPAPEWTLERLSDDPRVEFLQNVSLREESDQSFVLRPRVPVSLGEGVSFRAGDRIFFRQPLASDMIYHLGSDLAGRRFARGRVIALPGRSESERLFTLAALDDVLLGRPALPELHVRAEAARGFVAVSAENASPHASVVSRTSNWVEIQIPSAGIRDVQTGGFDRFEVYDRYRQPVTLSLATVVRFYETLIGPHEKIEPARILLRGSAPRDCCQTRFHVLAASGKEVLSDAPMPPPR